MRKDESRILDANQKLNRRERELTMITQDGTVIVVNKEAPMPRDKIKPPAETKAQLMAQVYSALEAKFRLYPGGPAVEFLLNFFTAADLVGIREELRK